MSAFSGPDVVPKALVSKNKMGENSDFRSVWEEKGGKLNHNHGKLYSKVGAERLQGTEAVRGEEGEVDPVDRERTLSSIHSGARIGFSEKVAFER